MHTQNRHCTNNRPNIYSLHRFNCINSTNSIDNFGIRYGRSAPVLTIKLSKQSHRLYAVRSMPLVDDHSVVDLILYWNPLIQLTNHCPVQCGVLAKARLRTSSKNHVQTFKANLEFTSKQALAFLLLMQAFIFRTKLLLWSQPLSLPSLTPVRLHLSRSQHRRGHYLQSRHVWSVADDFATIGCDGREFLLCTEAAAVIFNGFQ